MKDNSWIRFGKEDPYFAVITHDQYKSKNLNPQSLQGFFQSGEEHVAHVLATLKNNFNLTAPAFKNVLDFGCGLGRLVIPFATRFEKVIGVDNFRSNARGSSQKFTLKKYCQCRTAAKR